MPVAVPTAVMFALVRENVRNKQLQALRARTKRKTKKELDKEKLTRMKALARMQTGLLVGDPNVDQQLALRIAQNAAIQGE